MLAQLQEIYDSKGKIELHDLEVGFDLSDEQLMFRRKQFAGFAGDVEKWKTEFPYCWREAFATAGRKLIHSTVMDTMDLAASEPLATALAEIKGQASLCRVLGSYPKAVL